VRTRHSRDDRDGTSDVFIHTGLDRCGRRCFLFLLEYVLEIETERSWRYSVRSLLEGERGRSRHAHIATTTKTYTHVQGMDQAE